MPSITDLPCELIIAILKQLDHLRSLAPALLTCSPLLHLLPREPRRRGLHHPEPNHPHPTILLILPGDRLAMAKIHSQAHCWCSRQAARPAGGGLVPGGGHAEDEFAEYEPHAGYYPHVGERFRC